jgi:hypothetical protein
MRRRRFENKQKCSGSEKMHENRHVWPIAAGNALMQRDGHWAMLKGDRKAARKSYILWAIGKWNCPAAIGKNVTSSIHFL